MPLIERPLRCSKTVVVLRGPAAAGKTTAALDMYRHFLDADHRPRCLLLAPNAAAVAALRRQLLDASPAGLLVQPQVTTFSSLARRMLAAAGKTAKIISPFRRRLLLRQIVDRLAQAGRLPALRAVADTGGLMVSLDRAIAELKRAAVEPEQLAAAVGRAKGPSGDLLRVYRLYQQALLAEGLCDREGLMWLARDVLAAAGDQQPMPGLAGISAVAADGFTDFTPTQLQMLALLASRADRLLITLPHADDGRDRMWRWTGRTLDEIRRAMGTDVEVIDAAARPGPLSGMWEAIFRTDPDGAAPRGLGLIAAATAEAEVAAVASKVKRLLTASARSDGPGPDVAVLARSMAEYRPIVQRSFSECEIPTRSAPLPLDEVPVIRFLLHVASIPPDFAFRDVLRVIASSYFRPQALGPYGPDDVAAAQMVIRAGNVVAGRRAYAAAAERLARRSRVRDLDDEDLPRRIADMPREALLSAGHMLEALFDLAAAAEDADGVLKLIDSLQLRQAATDLGVPELTARDLRALGALREAIADLPRPRPSAAQLRQVVAAIRCPPARGEAVVDVLDILDARALRYDHVFILGAGEGLFPPKFTESALIREADRLAWRKHDVRLDSRGDLTAREMLLFYLAVSRADQTLTISFVDGGNEGASAPSPFLLSALACVGGLAAAERNGMLERISPGALIPPAEQIACRQDALNAAIGGLFQPGKGASAALNWTVANAPEAIRRSAMGLLARHRRWLPGRCDRFDGRITAPRLLARLAETFPGGTVFSASQLNSFGQCPWQFFAFHVLKLEPLVEPERLLEPVGRGIFVHDVLFRLMSALRQEAGRPVRLDRISQDKLDEALNSAIEAASGQADLRRPAYPAVWEIQKDQMRSELRAYLLGQRKDEKGEKAFFELGFGLTGPAGRLCDPASRPEPITVDTPSGAVRLAGKIDRVDYIDDGLFVIDYKTGLLPSKADIDSGRALQLAIYTAAVEQTLHRPGLGGAYHRVTDGGERHFSRLKPPRGDNRTLEQRRDEAAATIGRFVESMAAGRFDVAPTDDCPSWCPFRQICHYSPARARVKLPGAQPGREDRQ